MEKYDSRKHDIRPLFLPTTLGVGYFAYPVHVFIEDLKIVGFCYFEIEGSILYIDRIQTFYLRRGYGTKMVTVLKEYAKLQGITCIEGFSSETNFLFWKAQGAIRTNAYDFRIDL